jgi:fluoride exporter
VTSDGASPDTPDLPPGVSDAETSFPVDPDLLPSDPSAPSPTHVRVEHVHRARRLDVLSLIAAGGFAGTVARYGVTLGWHSPPDGFPLAIWTVNTSGAFMIGVIMTMLARRGKRSSRVQPLCCTGFLGSWTTMSTFAMQTDLIARHGSVGIALAYIVATLVTGLTATWLGMTLGRRMSDPVAS